MLDARGVSDALHTPEAPTAFDMSNDARNFERDRKVEGRARQWVAQDFRTVVIVLR
jgi:hypothetical protein